jgi:small subunit ribosomal protein S16
LGGTVPVPTRHASRPPPIRWEKTAAVAVKIKLKRLGKIRAPYYRIVVADARTKRDGRAIEEIGKYHPKADPSFIEVDSERVQHWLSVGAQPTDPVRKIFEVTGDWQKFKGLPGAEGKLKVAAPTPSKLELFNAALAAADGGPDTDAATPKKKKAPAKKAAAADKADKAGKAENATETAEAVEAVEAEEAVKAPAETETAAPAESSEQAEPAEPASES